MRFLAYMLLGLGLVLFIEGLVYFAFPEGVKRMLAALEALEPGALRVFGFGAMLAGVLLIGLFRLLLG